MPDGMDGHEKVCSKCGAPWEYEGELCIRCMAELDPSICAECGVIFSKLAPRSQGNAKICVECFEELEAERKRAAAQEAADREAAWDRAIEAMSVKPEAESEDLDAELAACAGESAGPEAFDPPTSLDEAERQARARLYAQDLEARRPIAYVPFHRLLSGWMPTPAASGPVSPRSTTNTTTGPGIAGGMAGPDPGGISHGRAVPAGARAPVVNVAGGGAAAAGRIGGDLRRSDAARQAR